MFGRARPAPSSPDSLERTPSKIVKDHSLSIFENTLLKLKLGSKLQLDSRWDQSKAAYSTDEELILTDEDSTADAVTEENNNVSVAYLFSKYHRHRSREPLILSCDKNNDTCSQ